MIGFLIYLPTLAFVPHLMYLISILYAFYRYYQNKTSLSLFGKNYLTHELSIVFVIILLSTLNYAFGWGIESVFSTKMPFFLLVPFTILVSMVMNRTDFQVLIALIFVETLVVFLEYIMGVSTFFSSLERYSEIGSSSLWYYNKPLGLSLNSSVIALKLFIAFLLVDIIKMKGMYSVISRIVFVIGMFLTFNRSVLIALLSFLILRTLFYFFQKKVSSMKWTFALMLASSVFVLSIAFAVNYWDVLVSQMTRNTGKVELSGREKIWNYFLGFISENPFFGNHSRKLYWGDFHAHNSFIQLVANNGILIALAYVYMIVRNIRMNNFIYILPILIYSIFQYGIFWGISLLDIVFFHFLLKFKRE